MKPLSRFDLHALQAEPAWQALQRDLETEHTLLVEQLAFHDYEDKERHEKRARLLFIKELLTWADRKASSLPKEA